MIWKMEAATHEATSKTENPICVDDRYNNMGVLRRSPMMWAAFAGHVHIMQFFRNYDDTYPNATALTDGTYSNVIGLAALRERKNVIEYLNGYPCDIPDADGRSHLWYATSNGHLESLKLLQKNASLRNRRDNQGFTPFAIEAYKGHSKIVYLLRDIADLSVPTHAGHTALHLATSGGHLECVKLFLHPSINVLRASKIRNTYALAQSLGYHEICRVFEVYGLGSI